ncbi:cell division suppressor protein YneA [Bacillus velezensis]|uniref:cell division suppressor protein YneA n=1 Tax=Bacillus TaxID=1386 RepID=UPI0006A8F91F|nr:MULTISPECIES: cell division suppressor protein YneA [Bacillus]AMQ74241.1 peptidoglycan-binding protein [Bacillus amyloliquefaciens UMAF6614]AWM48095.1 cell division suppressor protein YneA [Bacillus amyloliquefaciens]MBF6668118.1 cell division suppressor protein YneA [Bacillus velezensis]MBU0443076.1 cell division suppressor protein YneA [Bacillus amyloliquefaciens]MCE4940757.1 cell division suppressor protein YneA [Bacillus velezensis]
MAKESIIFVGLFTAILSAAILLVSCAGNDQSLSQYVKIKVQDGDTLWSLADHVAEKKHINKEDFIEWVTENNHLQTADIKPGDELFLPVKKKHPAVYQLAIVN